MHHTALHCTTLQHTAAQCKTLQHTATHCITLHHTASHCTTRHHTAPHCTTLHHSATYCTCDALSDSIINTTMATTAHCNALHHTTSHCYLLNTLPLWYTSWYIQWVSHGCDTCGGYPKDAGVTQCHCRAHTHSVTHAPQSCVHTVTLLLLPIYLLHESFFFFRLSRTPIRW